MVTGTSTTAHWVGGFYVNLQMVYGFINPLGPIIANARDDHAPRATTRAGIR